MEQRGIPTVMIIADSFVSFARRIAATQGYPSIFIADTPNPIQDLEPSALRRRVEQMMEAIIDGLTLPRSGIERPAGTVAPEPSRFESHKNSARPV